MAVITVSGLYGSGKTTVSRILAKKLGLRYVCTGSIVRKLAADNGMSLIDFEKKIAEKDKKYDKMVDDMQRQEAKAGDVVIDSRLGGWFVDANLKVWLDAPVSVRSQRVSVRENVSVEEAKKRIIERDGSDVERYKNYYKIDLNDTSVYDMIIDTSKLSPEEIVSKILETPAKKSGQKKVGG